MDKKTPILNSDALTYFITIPPEISKNADRYSQLEDRLREIVTGLVWYAEEGSRPVPVAIIKTGMTSENTRLYQDSLLKTTNGILKKLYEPVRVQDKVYTPDRLLYRDFACLKLTCFETQTGLQFYELLKQRGLESVWNTSHAGVWTLKLQFKECGTPFHFMGGEN